MTPKEEVRKRARSSKLVSDHQLWDIFTATRGPDNENDLLKDRTTIRVRTWLGGLFNPHGFEETDLDKPNEAEDRSAFRGRVSEQIRQELKLHQDTPGLPHFLYHYTKACWAIHEIEEASKPTTTTKNKKR